MLLDQPGELDGVPHLLVDDPAATGDRGPDAVQIARLVGQGRGHVERRAVRGHPLEPQVGGAVDRVLGVQDPLRLAGGARGEHDLAHVVWPWPEEGDRVVTDPRCVTDGQQLVPAPGIGPRVAGRPLAIDDDQVLDPGCGLPQLAVHGGEAEAPVVVDGDDDPWPGQGRHDPHLVVAEDRGHRVDHRPRSARRPARPPGTPAGSVAAAGPRGPGGPRWPAAHGSAGRRHRRTRPRSSCRAGR